MPRTIFGFLAADFHILSAPTALDRMLGMRFGVKAVELAEAERFGEMVSYHQYHVDSVPIAEAVEILRTVPPDGELVETARKHRDLLESNRAGSDLGQAQAAVIRRP